jgi:hypothetical protein
MTQPVDVQGLLLQLRDAQLHGARAVLAVRRRDRLSSEALLILAQRALTMAEIDLLEVAAGRRKQ